MRSFVRKLAYILILLSLLGCLPRAAPLPQPTQLSSIPSPTGSRPGDLEAVYISTESTAGAGRERCHALVRFYPDGAALYENFVCFDAPPGREDLVQLDRWFQPQNRDIQQGDYFVRDQLVWMRIVNHNPAAEVTSLRFFQGEQCNGRMVLQEPAVRWYTGVPSEITQPVLEFEQLGGTNGAIADMQEQNCRVAAFKILFRPTVVLANGQARYEFQTDPGELCNLQYTAPDGSERQAAGTGVITADSEGICRWIWDLGNTPGIGTVTVRIDEITQEFSIEIR
jgi:hypothetical protein